MSDRILGLLGLAVKGGKVEFGVFRTERAIDTEKAKLVILSGDIGESNKRRITAKCKNAGVRMISYSDKVNLSHAVGKQNIPAVTVCDEGFADAIVKIFGGVSE